MLMGVVAIKFFPWLLLQNVMFSNNMTWFVDVDPLHFSLLSSSLEVPTWETH